MIKLEKLEVMGWEHVIRGMRNPMNSWEKSDSKQICQVLKSEEVCPGVERTYWEPCVPFTHVGEADHKLMMQLRNAGTDHRKFMRMITVYVDITAPLYWWKEFDTYKVGTVANSCSTMHKIHEKPLSTSDFSCECLTEDSLAVIPNDSDGNDIWSSDDVLHVVIIALNELRRKFLETGNKAYWDQMIQLLPSSYNQKRTVMLNYEVLANIYKSRKNHKLDEWREFCQWIEQLPYSELITGEVMADD